MLSLVQEPPRGIVGGKVDALDHPNRYQGTTDARIESPNGPKNRGRLGKNVVGPLFHPWNGRSGIAPAGSFHLVFAALAAASVAPSRFAAVARAMILYARRFLGIGFGTAFFLGASQKFILAQCVCLNPNLEAVQGISNDGSRRSS